MKTVRDLGDVVGDVEALDLGTDGAAPRGGRGAGVREEVMATAVRVGPEDEHGAGTPRRCAARLREGPNRAPEASAAAEGDDHYAKLVNF